MVGAEMGEAPEYLGWAEKVVKAMWNQGPETLRDERLVDDAVRGDVYRFRSWYNWAGKIETSMLAVKSSSGLRPVIPRRVLKRHERQERPKDVLSRVITQEGLAHLDATEVSPDEARKLFEHGLIDFMAARRKGTEELKANADNWRRFPSDSIAMIAVRNGAAVPGCRFTVTSNTSGLRALWSPAYGMSINAFGHPTSPVSSYLLSGTYIFGVDSGAYVNPCWDHAQVTLPGSSPSVHLNF